MGLSKYLDIGVLMKEYGMELVSGSGLMSIMYDEISGGYLLMVGDYGDVCLGIYDDIGKCIRDMVVLEDSFLVGKKKK